MAIGTAVPPRRAALRVSIRESAVLFFDEPNRNLARAYAVSLIIPEPNAQLGSLPSLLGRDVLDRWYMHYDPSRAKLSFTVRGADHTQAV